MKKIIPIIVLLIIVFSFLIPQITSAKDIPKPTMKLNVPLGKFGKTEGQMSLGKYVSVWYGFTIGIVGILATVMIMWGGFKWLTSRGNQSVIGDAKEIIWSAIIGLFIAFLSYTILYILNPNLTKLGIHTNLMDINSMAPPSLSLSQKQIDSRALTKLQAMLQDGVVDAAIAYQDRNVVQDIKKAINNFSTGPDSGVSKKFQKSLNIQAWHGGFIDKQGRPIEGGKIIIYVEDKLQNKLAHDKNMEALKSFLSNSSNFSVSKQGNRLYLTKK